MKLSAQNDANTIRELAVARAERGLTANQKKVARTAADAAYSSFVKEGAPHAHLFEFDSFGPTAANPKVTDAIEARLYDRLRDNGFVGQGKDEPLVRVYRGTSYAEGTSFAQFLATP